MTYQEYIIELKKIDFLYDECGLSEEEYDHLRNIIIDTGFLLSPENCLLTTNSNLVRR